MTVARLVRQRRRRLRACVTVLLNALRSDGAPEYEGLLRAPYGAPRSWASGSGLSVSRQQ